MPSIAFMFLFKKNSANTHSFKIEQINFNLEIYLNNLYIDRKNLNRFNIAKKILINLLFTLLK